MDFCFLYRRIKNNTTVVNTVVFAFFSFLNSGINFLLLFVLAKFISPEEYGLLNLFNTFISVSTVFISLSTSGYVSVAYFKEKNRDYEVTISTILSISIFVLFFLSGLTIVISSDVLLEAFGICKEYLLYAIWICFFQNVIALNLDIWRIEEKILLYGWYSFLIVTINTVATLLFIIIFSYGWVGRVYTQLYATTFFAIISICVLYKKKLLSILPHKKDFWRILLFGIPLIPHAASFWVRQGLDRYVINYYYSAIEVGLFSLAMNFSSVINVVGNAFNATNSVYIYKILAQGYNEQNRCALEKRNKYSIFFFLFFSLLIMVLGGITIPLFFPMYMLSLPYIVPLCIGAFFQCIYLVYVNILFFYSRTKQLMYITFVSAIVHAVSSLFLTKYSLVYTGVIFMLSNLIPVIGVFFYSRYILVKYDNYSNGCKYSN